MKKILDLAQTFQQNSAQEVKIIEQQTKQDLNELRTAIQLELKKSEQSITAAIQMHERQMNTLIVKSCRMSLIFLVIGFLLLLAANFYLGKTLYQTHKEYQYMTQESQKLGDLMHKAKILKWQTCLAQNGKKYLCVAVHPDSEKMRIKDLNYQIIFPLQPIQDNSK